MTTATATKKMTAEEFFALPDDGTERMLIAGELRVGSMTRRNRFHSVAVTLVATELENWRRQQPQPRGQVLTGEAGVRLAPETAFGVDVVYVSAELLARQTDETTMIDGVPTLAVEVLSPSDTVEDIRDKIESYRAAGVPLVWVLDPYLRTVTVHRPDAEPELFNVREQLTAEPHLPGFRVAVARLFA